MQVLDLERKKKPPLNRRSDVERKLSVLQAIKDGETKISRVALVANVRHEEARRWMLDFAGKHLLRLAPNGYRSRHLRESHFYVDDLCYLQVVIADKGLFLLNEWKKFSEMLECL